MHLAIWLLCGPMLPDAHHNSRSHCHSNYPYAYYNPMPHNHTCPHNRAAHVRKHRVPEANGDEAQSSEDYLQRISRPRLQLCRMLLGTNNNSCANHNSCANNHALPNNHACPNNHALPNNRPIHLQELLLPSSICLDCQA